MDVHTPHDGGRGGGRGDAAEGPAESGGAIAHCSCGLAGLLTTAVVVALSYPFLVAATKPLHLLSSTALVFILASLWLLSWLVLELTWEWQAGRLHGES